MLNNMYRKFGIDCNKRGQDKRIHGKSSKRAPKKGTFSCIKQCDRVFVTVHHRELHEACCKHLPSNRDVQDVCIVDGKPHSSGKRPSNTRCTVARKKQCTNTHVDRREVQDVQEAIIDTMVQPTLAEDNFMHAATEARTLLDEHGQQSLESRGKQRVRDNDASPSSPSKRRHHSSSSTPSTICHAISPPKESSLSPYASSTTSPSASTPIAPPSSSSSFSSSSSRNVLLTPWVPCHISAVPGSELVEVGSLLSKSKNKVTMALTLLGASGAQDIRKPYPVCSPILISVKTPRQWIAFNRF